MPELAAPCEYRIFPDPNGRGVHAHYHAHLDRAPLRNFESNN